MGVRVAPSAVEAYELWPENAVALDLLSHAQWQWLAGMTVARIGIDQSALWALIDGHPEAPTEKAERWRLFSDVLAAGEACCEIWSRHN